MTLYNYYYIIIIITLYYIVSVNYWGEVSIETIVNYMRIRIRLYTIFGDIEFCYSGTILVRITFGKVLRDIGRTKIGDKI